jgi:hypothetical protein
VVTTLACFTYYLHARLRVHWASGIPCALFYQRCDYFLQNSGEAAPRECFRLFEN